MRIARADNDPLVVEYLEAKSAVEGAQRRLDEASAALLSKMAFDHEKTREFRRHDGRVWRLTYVQTHTPVIDEKGLRKALGARVFDKYTVKKLDKKLMERAMDVGEVDPVTVAKFVSEKPSKPYLRATLVEKEESSGGE